MVLFYLFYYRHLDTYTALRLTRMCLQGEIISVYQTVCRIIRLFKWQEEVGGKDERRGNCVACNDTLFHLPARTSQTSSGHWAFSSLSQVQASWNRLGREDFHCILSLDSFFFWLNLNAVPFRNFDVRFHRFAARASLKSCEGLGSSVCGVPVPDTSQCLPFPCSQCLSLGAPGMWGPIQLACDSSAPSFSPAPFLSPLITGIELEGDWARCRLWGAVPYTTGGPEGRQFAF